MRLYDGAFLHEYRMRARRRGGRGSRTRRGGDERRDVRLEHRRELADEIPDAFDPSTRDVHGAPAVLHERVQRSFTDQLFDVDVTVETHGGDLSRGTPDIAIGSLPNSDGES
jgi:hypothetical protein